MVLFGCYTVEYNKYNKAGEPWSINLPNSLLWFVLSKALEASTIVTYIEEPLAISCRNISFNKYMSISVECRFLIQIVWPV